MRKHGSFFIQILSVFAIVATATTTRAQEGIGDVSLSDFLLEPTFVYSEDRQGSFSAGGSYFEVTWTKDALISGVIKAGTTELLGKPARYGKATSDDIGLVEAYAQADSDYGRVRLGLVPIPFGLEGGDAETRLRFPRSLPYRARFIGLRDYGMSYRIFYNGFFSDWAIHNGEGGSDLDHETWFTARWGWQGGKFLRIGFSGMAGRTKPASTNPGGTGDTNDAFYDITRGARIRVANFFADWQFSPFRLEFETTAGDTRQENSEIKFRSLRSDLEWQTSRSFSILARYDLLDPRNDVTSDRVSEVTAGVAWRGTYDTSVLYFLGTKSFGTGNDQDDHRGMVIWRVTPQALSSRAAL